MAAWAVSAVLTGVAHAAAPAETAGGPALLTLEPQGLNKARERVRQGDALLQPAYQALLRRADRALQVPPRSVTHKTTVPPSGDRRDYMSLGPYWWPDPAKPDGLPYVQRDGQRNPQSTGPAYDAARLQGLLNDTRDLALAFHFTGDARYAHKAAEALRVWFLDPATRMNPHLRYGQAVPGVAEGRGIGIIDTRDLWWVMDAVALIAPSGQGLNADERAALNRWFADYAQWLDTSDLGRDEAAAANNHGLFYDVQMVALWLQAGDVDRARRLLMAVQTNRFAKQFAPSGVMPLELARTRPYHYHAFTLEAITRLAHYAQVAEQRRPPGERWTAEDPRCREPVQDLRCPLDLWRVQIEGRSIGRVIDFVSAPLRDAAAWTRTTALEPTPPLATAVPVLLAARGRLPAGHADTPVPRLQQLAPEHWAWLVWPPADKP